MAREWPLPDTESELSHIIDAAHAEGPQVITRQGHEAAIVLSSEDYRKLLGRKQTISEFFQSSPLVDVELDIFNPRTL